MEALLFKAQGVGKKQKITLLICGLVLLAIGIIIIAFSQMRKGEWESSPTTYVDGMGAVTTYNYSKGTGRYIFDFEVRMIFIAIGLLIIIYAIFTFIKMIFSNKTYVAIYENHIECMAYPKPKLWNLTFDRIKDAQLFSSDMVTLFTDTQKINLQISEAEQVYQIIREKIEAR